MSDEGCVLSSAAEETTELPPWYIRHIRCTLIGALSYTVGLHVAAWWIDWCEHSHRFVAIGGECEREAYYLESLLWDSLAFKPDWLELSLPTTQWKQVQSQVHWRPHSKPHFKVVERGQGKTMFASVWQINWKIWNNGAPSFVINS